MIRLGILISLVLLLTAEHASAQNTMTSDQAVLTPNQCNEVWSREVTDGDSRAQADTTAEILSFAQIDTTDAGQVDPNNDGIIDQSEFEAACAKGLVYAPPRGKK
jgi:hypothetical protein